MSHRSRLTHAFMPKLLDRSNSSVASTSPLKKSSSGSSYATGRLHSVLYSNRSTTRPGNDLHVLAARGWRIFVHTFIDDAILCVYVNTCEA
jgi:hypothetical protein